MASAKRDSQPSENATPASIRCPTQKIIIKRYYVGSGGSENAKGLLGDRDGQFFTKSSLLTRQLKKEKGEGKTVRRACGSLLPYLLASGTRSPPFVGLPRTPPCPHVCFHIVTLPTQKYPISNFWLGRSFESRS